MFKNSANNKQKTINFTINEKKEVRRNIKIIIQLINYHFSLFNGQF